MADGSAHTLGNAADARLYRSRDAHLGGVCAGIAARYDCDAIVVRILVILLTGLTFGVVAVVYAVMWARIPLEPESPHPYEVMPEHAESVAHGSLDFADPFQDEEYERVEPGKLSIVPRLIMATGLMALFLAVSAGLASSVQGSHWWQFWPLAFLILGICLVVIPAHARREVVWHALGIVVMSFAVVALPMSVGLASWETFPYALRILWPLLVVAAVLFVLGWRRGRDGLIVAAALCVALFFLVALLAFALPGDAGALFATLPDSRTLRIALPFA